MTKSKVVIGMFRGFPFAFYVIAEIVDLAVGSTIKLNGERVIPITISAGDFDPWLLPYL